MTIQKKKKKKADITRKKKKKKGESYSIALPSGVSRKKGGSQTKGGRGLTD